MLRVSKNISLCPHTSYTFEDFFAHPSVTLKFLFILLLLFYSWNCAFIACLGFIIVVWRSKDLVSFGIDFHWIWRYSKTAASWLAKIWWHWQGVQGTHEQNVQDTQRCQSKFFAAHLDNLTIFRWLSPKEIKGSQSTSL